MTQALMSGGAIDDDDATEVSDLTERFELTGDRWQPYNVTHAAEPISEKKHPGDSMLSIPALHKYIIIALVVALGITLLVLIEHKPVAIGVFLGTLCEGWLVGQLFRWEPPR